jgi:hypothetical protein
MTGSVELFTVRLWQEMLNEKQTEWRGKIQHVGSGEVCYFRDWSKMMNFIDTTLSDLGSHKAEVTMPSENDRFRSAGGQTERWRAREVPQLEPANIPVPMNENWHQVQITSRLKKVKARFFLNTFGKLWRALSGGYTDRLRVVKNLGVMLIAALLIVFGLNHIVVIDPKTTSVIFGTKPLLLGISGIFEGISQKQRQTQSVEISGEANSLKEKPFRRNKV